MLKLYEKIARTEENLLGIQELEKETPIIGKEPCLLCISAQSMHPKSVFGIIREGMQAARIRTSQENGPGYDIKNFPSHFLGLSFQQDEEYKNQGVELAETYFLPILQKAGKKVEVQEAKNKLRNINILTYCDGTKTYIEAEKALKERMKQLGYSNEEEEDILSQISVIAIATMQDTSKISASCTAFIDVNDTEIWTPMIVSLKESLEKDKKKISQEAISKNSSICYFNGPGHHSLKEYLKDTSLAKVPICTVVASSLNNSIYNQNAYTKIPYSQNKSFYHMTLNYYNSEGFTPEEAIELFDQSLEYETAKKITPEMMETLNMFDRICKTTVKLKKENETLRERVESSQEKNQKLISTIEEIVPQDIYYEILVKGTGFQMPAKEISTTNSSKGRK